LVIRNLAARYTRTSALHHNGPPLRNTLRDCQTVEV